MGNVSTLALQKRDLSKNNLGNDGLKIISEFIGVNYGRTRMSINLSYLNLADNNFTSLSFETFCR